MKWSYSDLLYVIEYTVKMLTRYMYLFRGRQLLLTADVSSFELFVESKFSWCSYFLRVLLFLSMKKETKTLEKLITDTAKRNGFFVQRYVWIKCSLKFYTLIINKFCCGKVVSWMEKSTSNFIFDKESLSAFKIALGASARDTTMYSRRVSLQIYVQLHGIAYGRSMLYSYKWYLGKLFDLKVITTLLKEYVVLKSKESLSFWYAEKQLIILPTFLFMKCNVLV